MKQENGEGAGTIYNKDAVKELETILVVTAHCNSVLAVREKILLCGRFIFSN